MNFARPQPRYKASLDITPLIDVVFLLLAFLLLTMTFTEDRPEVEEAIKKLAIQNRDDNHGGEVIIPLRSIRMMLPKYETDKSMKELFKIYIDNNIEDNFK